MYSSDGSGNGKRSFTVLSMHFGGAEVSQVAVKALLVYASDQFGEGLEKKTKVSIPMEVYVGRPH